MKKSILCLLIVALIASCKPIKKQDGFTIKGTVSADTKGWVYLKELKNREYIVIDSVQIVDNAFVFEGKVEQPMVYLLTPEQASRRVPIYVENTQITVALNNDWEIETITGTDNTTHFNALLAKAAEGTLQSDSLVRSNPNSPIGVYFLNKETYKYDYTQLSDLRKILTDSLKNHPYTAQLDEVIALLAKIQPGQPAPEFTLPTPQGDSLNLSSLKGKYVILDFWASWCPDCRKSNPELVKIYEKYKSKNVTILSISLDEDQDKWLAAIQKDGLVWNNVITGTGWNNPVTAAYAIKWIPMTFLIDPNGVIVTRTAEVADIDARLGELTASK